MEEIQEDINKPLTDQEEAFAQAYVIHRQKAKAAREAGYSKRTDRIKGHQVYNRPNVRERIRELVKASTISGEDAVKILSDMSEFNMADYMIPTDVYEQPMVKVSLADLINKKKEELRREEEFLKRKQYTEEVHTEQDKLLNIVRNEILRMEIDLEANPKEIRIVKGEPRLIKKMQLDIDRLVKDKEKGRIKSIKYTKDGIQVEGYDAQLAAVNLAKIHGEFEKDNKQKQPVINNNITREEIQKIAKDLEDSV